MVAFDWLNCSGKWLLTYTNQFGQFSPFMGFTVPLMATPSGFNRTFAFVKVAEPRATGNHKLLPHPSRQVHPN